MNNQQMMVYLLPAWFRHICTGLVALSLVKLFSLLARTRIFGPILYQASNVLVRLVRIVFTALFALLAIVLFQLVLNRSYNIEAATYELYESFLFHEQARSSLQILTSVLTTSLLVVLVAS